MDPQHCFYEIYFLLDKGSNVTVVKNEETGLISSASVLSADVLPENPDDAEFREQEIFS
jgi:hypothetical protein